MEPRAVMRTLNWLLAVGLATNAAFLLSGDAPGDLRAGLHYVALALLPIATLAATGK